MPSPLHIERASRLNSLPSLVGPKPARTAPALHAARCRRSRAAALPWPLCTMLPRYRPRGRVGRGPSRRCGPPASTTCCFPCCRPCRCPCPPWSSSAGTAATARRRLFSRLCRVDGYNMTIQGSAAAVRMPCAGAAVLRWHVASNAVACKPSPRPDINRNELQASCSHGLL